MTAKRSIGFKLQLQNRLFLLGL